MAKADRSASTKRTSQMSSRILTIGFAIVLSVLCIESHAGEPLRIATIQPLSGPFALVGEEVVKQLRASADLLNGKGGIYDGRKVEIIAFDGKATPQDSLLALKQVTDARIGYLVSNVSSVVHALSDAVVKHNARDPSNRVLLLNIDGRDPALTEAKCNFWHFRLNYHTDTEIDFLTSYLARQPAVRKVYLINQDYAFGQAIQRAARELLVKKSPGVQIVGDDLVPLGKVKDFAPYVAKIRASGADTVVTGNWGNDIFLLVRAGHDSGLDVRYYVLVGNVAGTTAGLGVAGVGKVWSLFPWHANVDPNPYASFNQEYKTKYNSTENFDYIPAHRAVGMLAKAMAAARSDEPLKVAYALEGMTYDGPDGRTWIRREDHQLIAPLYLANLVRAGAGGSKFDVEATGLGWRTVYAVEAKDAVPGLKCTMDRSVGQ
jgi:branched-chain amino acid transport system substrate-binding protein